MKKVLFLFLFLFGIFVANAENSESVYIYGIDFSSVKVYGADETVEQFENAFEGINLLLIKESKKYDFTDIVGADSKLKLDMVINLTKDSDFSDIKVYDKDIAPINVSEKIKNYPIKEKSGNGFIMIATLLDKSTNKATYNVVLFDVEPRKILKEKEFTSKAGGFGLRNFWARTIYTLTKKFEFDQHK